MKHAFCVSALTLALFATSASAQTSLFGSIYNFDVYNDTGQDAHGFQIELDGLTPQQAYYNFSATRYGAPTVIPFTGGVYVRYAATYNNGKPTMVSHDHGTSRIHADDWTFLCPDEHRWLRSLRH